MENDWTKVDAIVARVLDAHDGVAKMAMFKAADLTNLQVASALGRAVVERPRNGWYCRPDIPWEGKHAIRVGGVLSCVSAADSFGLPTPPRSYQRLHVLVPLNSARIRHHRSKHLYVVPGQDGEVTTHWSTAGRSYQGWRTPLIDTLLLLGDCVPVEWWIAALDAALHRPRDGEPLLTEAEYANFISRVPKRLRAALELVDARAESPLETLVRLGLVRRGIRNITPQFSPDGWQAVDLLVGKRLIVEADGAAFHDPEKDAIRDAAFRSLGYVVLRFGYDRIVNDIEGVIDEIEAALREIEPSF